ncbi:MAG: caspase family protein [Prevotella sp.]|nr:caspase family protein [Prevotella sp.]
MMKCRLAFLMIGLLCITSMNAQRKRAFMVGISHYDQALTGYQWNNIHGVEDVRLIVPLLTKQGFEITTCLDGEATYKNITERLNQFVNKITKGDIVYIHFSTHGQPVEDLNGDEEDGWDEAIVPIDAYKIYNKGVYEGKKHLIDDKLNSYVKQLREKMGQAGFLYVVIDACHAGTSSRGQDDVVRGTRVGFTYHNKIYKPIVNKKSHYQLESSAKLAQVMFLEACRADQVNIEVKVGEGRYGALSYNISQALLQEPLGRNPSSFLKSVKDAITKTGKWSNNQNLVVETSY